MLCLVLQIQIGTFVECCVTLLQRPDLLPSALSQSRIVRMLLSFVDSSSRDRRYHELSHLLDIYVYHDSYLLYTTGQVLVCWVPLDGAGWLLLCCG